MEQSVLPHDFLLDICGMSDFRLHAITPSLQERGKEGSYSDLMKDLFNSDESPEHMDICQDFAKDSESTEVGLKAWEPPALLTDESMKAGISTAMPQQQQQQGNQQQQQLQLLQGSSGITNMAFTLEYQTMQVTQRPQILYHPGDGTTCESVPNLPSDVLQLRSVPVLPVFSASSTTSVHQLVTVDPEVVDEILSPISLQSPVVIEATNTTEAPQSRVAEDLDLDSKIEFIKRAVAQYHNTGAATSNNGKMQVHEAVLVLLLAQHFGADEANLGSILTFCDEDGFERSDCSGNNFMARDTKMIGRIWQKLKGNKNAKYDTFARAMRVGRERNKEYFDYLDTGKGTKKRIYKLGPKARKEIDRMKTALQQLSCH